MRKITEQIVSAFLAFKVKVVGNSHTHSGSLFLHGHCIAYHGTRNGERGIFITNAGWGASTTRERLNGVLNLMGHKNERDYARVLGVYQRNHVQMIGHRTIGFKAGGTQEREFSGTFFVTFPADGRRGMEAVSKCMEVKG